MVATADRETAPEHVRNALAMVSLVLQTGEPVPSADGVGILVLVTELEAVQHRLQRALAQLEPGT